MINLIINISIFFFFINFSCAQNMFNENGEREGVWIGYHSNGQIKYDGQFWNGKEFGVFKYYDVAGNLAIKLNYLDTGLTSKATVYYSSGAIKSQGYYYANKKNNLWITYSASGKKIQQEQYDQGVLNGESLYFYNNETIAESYYFVNGKKNGLGRKFYRSGFLNMICNYENNFPHGFDKFFYNKKGEVLESKGMFKVGRKDSIWEFYDEQGFLIKKENFNSDY